MPVPGPVWRPRRLSAPAGSVAAAGSAASREGSGPPVPVLSAGPAPEGGIGVTIAELLIERMLASGRFRVLDATQLEALWREQERVDQPRARSRRSRPEPPKPGTMYLLQGTITRLGIDESSIGTGGGGGGILAAVGLRRRETQVGLTARLVDAATGEVVASVTALGKSRKGRSALLGGLGAGAGGAVMVGGRQTTAATGQAIERAVRGLGAELLRATKGMSGAGADGAQGARGP